MNRLTMLLIAALGISLSGCAGMATAPGGKSRVQASKPNTLTEAGSKDIYIGNVAVEFLINDKVSATSKSGFLSGSTGFAKQMVTAKLTGVPESTMQQVANFALNDLKQKLTAKGYNVLSYSQYQALPDFAKTKPEASPLRPNMKAAAVMKLINTPSLSYTFAPSGMMLSDVAVGKQTSSSVPVVTANYTLGFAYFGTNTDSTMDYNTGSREYSAEVTTGQALTVDELSRIQLFVPNRGFFAYPGQVQLQDPVVVKAAYGSIADSTSTADKAANMFSNAVGVLSGGSMNVKRFEVQADPNRYAKAAERALDLANQRLLEKVGGI